MLVLWKGEWLTWSHLPLWRASQAFSAMARAFISGFTLKLIPWSLGISTYSSNVSLNWPDRLPFQTNVTWPNFTVSLHQTHNDTTTTQNGHTITYTMAQSNSQLSSFPVTIGHNARKTEHSWSILNHVVFTALDRRVIGCRRFHLHANVLTPLWTKYSPEVSPIWGGATK